MLAADAQIMLMDKLKKLFGMLTIFPIVYNAFLSLSQLVTLPKNPLKMDAWKTCFLLEWPISRGYV